MVEVYEFTAMHKIRAGEGVISPKIDIAQMPLGAPKAVHATAGEKTLRGDCSFIKIKGTGSITWPGGITEKFDGIEFRGVVGGQTITIVA